MKFKFFWCEKRKKCLYFNEEHKVCRSDVEALHFCGKRKGEEK